MRKYQCGKPLAYPCPYREGKDCGAGDIDCHYHEERRPVLPAKAKVMPMPKFIEGQIEDAFQRFWIQQQGGQTYYSSFVAGYKAGWNRLRRYMARGK